VAPRSHGKENLPLAQHNVAAAPGSEKKRPLGADAVKPSPAAEDGARATKAGDKEKKTTHKKAKALVSSAAAGAGEAVDAAGDCAQS